MNQADWSVTTPPAGLIRAGRDCFVAALLAMTKSFLFIAGHGQARMQPRSDCKTIGLIPVIASAAKQSLHSLSLEARNLAA